MNFWTTIKSPSRIILIIAIAIGAHLLVLAVRMLGKRLMKAMPKFAFAKGRSISMSIRKFDSEFSDCLISVGYELDSRSISIR